MNKLTIIHFNDVYEIASMASSDLGGLARVAALCQSLKATSSNALVTFAGDLYNPSGLGKAMMAGKKLDGKHAVAVMNLVGVDYMTLGDHELNTISEGQFYERLEETQFKIVSTNLRDEAGSAFRSKTHQILDYDMITLGQEGEPKWRIGILGITKQVDLPKVRHIRIPPEEAINDALRQLKGQTDMIILLSHQPIADDQSLARQFPQIDLILGGHDHHSIKSMETGCAPIFKADANARSVYLIEVAQDPESKRISISAELRAIDASIADAPEVAQEVQKWEQRAFESFRQQGLHPEKVVINAPTDFDGFDISIRNGNNDFTRWVTQVMMAAVAQAELALLCSWAIKLDDYIPKGGNITHYELIRMFYEDFQLYAVKLSGSFLLDILHFSETRLGSGFFVLSTPNISKKFIQEKLVWELNHQAIDPKKTYTVAMADDLLHDVLYVVNSEKRRGIQAEEAQASLMRACILYGLHATNLGV